MIDVIDIIFAALSLVLGLALTFQGLARFAQLMQVMGFLAGYYFVSILLTSYAPGLMYWLTIVISVLGGFFAASLLRRYPNVQTDLIGGLGGFLIGEMVIKQIVSFKTGWINFVVFIVCVLAGVWAMRKWSATILVWILSFIGGFMVATSLNYFYQFITGHFVKYALVVAFYSSPLMVEINLGYWLTLTTTILWFVLFIAGAMAQRGNSGYVKIPESAV